VITTLIALQTAETGLDMRHVLTIMFRHVLRKNATASG